MFSVENLKHYYDFMPRQQKIALQSGYGKSVTKQFYKLKYAQNWKKLRGGKATTKCVTARAHQHNPTSFDRRFTVSGFKNFPIDGHVCRTGTAQGKRPKIYR